MKKSAMARLQTRNLKDDTDDDYCGDYGGGDEDDNRPWDVDPVPAAREDKDHTAVAEQCEQEDDPDSTSEGPPENIDDAIVGDDNHVDDDDDE